MWRILIDGSCLEPRRAVYHAYRFGCVGQPLARCCVRMMESVRLYAKMVCLNSTMNCRGSKEWGRQPNFLTISSTDRESGPLGLSPRVYRVATEYAGECQRAPLTTTSLIAAFTAALTAAIHLGPRLSARRSPFAIVPRFPLLSAVTAAAAPATDVIGRHYDTLHHTTQKQILTHPHLTSSLRATHRAGASIHPPSNGIHRGQHVRPVRAAQARLAAGLQLEPGEI